MPTAADHLDRASGAAVVEVLRRTWWEGPEIANAGDPLRAWAADPAAGPLQGLALDEVPVPWREPLARAGVPLARGGLASWRDCAVGNEPLPRLADGVLVLPPVERFAQLTSLTLKPVRVWLQQRFGFRLQVGAGVEVYLWERRLVLVNRAAEPRHGFVYGPPASLRDVLQLEPGGWHEVRW